MLQTTAAISQMEYQAVLFKLKKAELRINSLELALADTRAELKAEQDAHIATQLKFKWATELLAIPSAKVGTSMKLTARRLVQDILPTTQRDENGFAVVRIADIYSGTGLSQSTTRRDLEALQDWGIVEADSDNHTVKLKVKNASFLANASYLGKAAPRKERKAKRPQILIDEPVCPSCGSTDVLGHTTAMCNQCQTIFSQLHREPDLDSIPDPEPLASASVPEPEPPTQLFEPEPAPEPPVKKRPEKKYPCRLCGTMCWIWLEDEQGGWWDCGCKQRSTTNELDTANYPRSASG